MKYVVVTITIRRRALAPLTASIERHSSMMAKPTPLGDGSASCFSETDAVTHGL